MPDIETEAVPAPAVPVTVMGIAKHDKVKFSGDHRWWTARAVSERFAVLTRQAEFKPKGEVAYTIIDPKRGVRGPCNLIGQGWDARMEDAACFDLLAALELHVRRDEWWEANRDDPAASEPTDIGRLLLYPPELEPEGVFPVEVSYRNNVSIHITAHHRASEEK